MAEKARYKSRKMLILSNNTMGKININGISFTLKKNMTVIHKKKTFIIQSKSTLNCPFSFILQKKF